MTEAGSIEGYHCHKVQRELNIALVHHTEKANEQGVMLCLWAGADPHAAAPSLRYDIPGISPEDDDEDEGLGVSAVWQACFSGHNEILERLAPDPCLDDFERLYCVTRNSARRRLIRNG